MSTFEYAMVLISIIVGLGITHILSNLGTAVHRLRHHGPAIRLESNYLAWIAFVFSWLVNIWWWEFKWSELAADFRPAVLRQGAGRLRSSPATRGQQGAEAAPCR